jgi:hypothetical protein
MTSPAKAAARQPNISPSEQKPSHSEQKGFEPLKTTNQRGYGQHHQVLRKQVAPRVAAGVVNCARCGKPIHPNEPFDLDHDDNDRRRYLGPSHRACNRATSGRRRQSRQW